MKDPLMARLLQLSEDFRNRYAKAEAVDERPLSDLDFARELKKRNRVDDGRSMVASLEQCFLRGALKYEAAFAVYGDSVSPGPSQSDVHVCEQLPGYQNDNPDASANRAGAHAGRDSRQASKDRGQASGYSWALQGKRLAS